MPQSAKILLLENIPTDAELVELQLRKSGLSLTEKRVTSKENFLRAIQEFTPDLILASFSIPRFDGLSALRMAGEITPGIPWVIISSAASEDIAAECMKLGASDYVSKRNLARLVPAIKRTLEKRSASAEKEKAEVRPQEQPTTEQPEAVARGSQENLFRLITENINDFIAVVDLQGRRLYNSPSYGRVLDEPDTLLGTDSFVDIYPEDRPRIKKVFEETIRTGVGHQTEYRLMDKDGNTRHIESRGSVIKDASGRPSGVVIVSRDVTERRLSEIAFRELVQATAGVTGEAFFQGLVKHLAAAIGTRFCLVSQCVDDRRERVRALAYWADGKLESPFEYDVVDTTCEQVVKGGKMSYYPDRLPDLFPKETALVPMKARSYLGIPLPGPSGIPAGHMFVMDDKPLAEPEEAVFIMKTFAPRAALELGRLHHKD